MDLDVAKDMDVTDENSVTNREGSSNGTEMTSLATRSKGAKLQRTKHV
jgi:hypothetical protein